MAALGAACSGGSVAVSVEPRPYLPHGAAACADGVSPHPRRPWSRACTRGDIEVPTAAAAHGAPVTRPDSGGATTLQAVRPPAGPSRICRACGPDSPRCSCEGSATSPRRQQAAETGPITTAHAWDFIPTAALELPRRPRAPTATVARGARWHIDGDDTSVRHGDGVVSGEWRVSCGLQATSTTWCCRGTNRPWVEASSSMQRPASGGPDHGTSGPCDLVLDLRDRHAGKHHRVMHCASFW